MSMVLEKKNYFRY